MRNARQLGGEGSLVYGINANVVHRWRQLAREGQASLPEISSGFVPVSLTSTPAPDSVSNTAIQVDLRRGAMTINWPTLATAEFAAWTRELLR